MRRILVVDDDRHVRRAIAAWLNGCGFRVAVADGSVNGLAALDETSFDLMIVDVLMPAMRGFESIRLFHQRAPAVPLIAISGYAFAGHEANDPACLKLALSLGATRCLRKPFRPTTLLADRRMPVGSRTASKASGFAFGRRQWVVRAEDGHGGVQYREGHYGLN